MKKESNFLFKKLCSYFLLSEHFKHGKQLDEHTLFHCTYLCFVLDSSVANGNEQSIEETNTAGMK